MLPSVLFLNPTGVEMPDANSRERRDSTERAPIALQTTRSRIYWGVIGSTSSVAHVIPSLLISRSNCRATFNPFDTFDLPSKSGSSISPFQPSPVRDFSKYARKMIMNLSSTSRASVCNFAAYSNASAGLWIEHGPTTRIILSMSPARIR